MYGDIPDSYQSQMDSFRKEYDALSRAEAEARSRAAEEQQFSGGQLAAAVLTSLLPMALGGAISGSHGVEAGAIAGASGLKSFQDIAGSRLAQRQEQASAEAQMLGQERRQVQGAMTQFGRDAVRDTYRQDQSNERARLSREAKAARGSSPADQYFSMLMGGGSLPQVGSGAMAEAGGGAVAEEIQQVLPAMPSSPVAALPSGVSEQTTPEDVSEEVAEQTTFTRPALPGEPSPVQKMRQSAAETPGLYQNSKSVDYLNKGLTAEGKKEALNQAPLDREMKAINVEKGQQSIQTGELDQKGKEMAIKAEEARVAKEAEIEKGIIRIPVKTFSGGSKGDSFREVKVDLSTIPDDDRRGQALEVAKAYEDALVKLNKIGETLKSSFGASRVLNKSLISDDLTALNRTLAQLETARVSGTRAGQGEGNFKRQDQIITMRPGSIFAELLSGTTGSIGLTPSMFDRYNKARGQIEEQMKSHLEGLAAKVEIGSGKRELPDLGMLRKARELRERNKVKGEYYGE